MLKIESIELHHLSIPFVNPFKFASGTKLTHSCILIAVKSNGLTGWGECPAFEEPYYTCETLTTANYILTNFLIPSLLGKNLNSPQDVLLYFSKVRGHPMAKAALECAVWDLFAQTQAIPLSQMFSGIRERVPVGVTVSLEKDIPRLVAQVDQFVAQGYNRIKLKIIPGWEVKPLQAIRERYPEIMLMVDANSSFNLQHLPLFKELDQFNLLMIEQPLTVDDFWEHSLLQAQLKTPLCLDESIESPSDVATAIALKSCQIINLKVSRVGGITNTLTIHQLCTEVGIKMWCGGMLESGVGRAINLHLATLPNFTLPGDISATERYFAEDITDPYFYLNQEDSTITVPTLPGIGVQVQKDRLHKFRTAYQCYS
jgi:O-succinylbenzoate synthase